MRNRKPLSPREQALKDFEDLLRLLDEEGADHVVRILRMLPRKRFLALCQYCG